MKQLVFNSFPRSGNVYSGHTCQVFFDGMFATVHIPEIFQVKEIANVTIFRKPSEAISSLQYKQLETSNTTKINLNEIKNHIHGACKLYEDYINYATLYNDNIYIGKFEDLIADTVLHFENVSKFFDLPLIPNYKNNYNKIRLYGKTWEDKNDGHIPRVKDEIRLGIEDAVEKIPIIQELDQKYKIFIEKYHTKVN